MPGRDVKGRRNRKSARPGPARFFFLKICTARAGTAGPAKKFGPAGPARIIWAGKAGGKIKDYLSFKGHQKLFDFSFNAINAFLCTNENIMEEN